MKLRGLVHNSYIHVSVSDLYILRISHDCGNWERSRAVSFLGIHKSDLLWSAFVTLIAFSFLQTDTLPEENRSGDGNSSTRKKVALFLSQLNCTLLQEGAKAKFAKDLFRKKPKIDFSIFTNTVRYRDKFLFMLFSKKLFLFPVGCTRNPDPVRDRNHFAGSNSAFRACRSVSEI
jgi:hypothetical protein